VTWTITGRRPDFALARRAATSRLTPVLPVLENGVLNLVAVVAFLIFAIGTIPAVLYLGTPRRSSDPERK
jgi:hypothetical protein